MMIYNIVDLKTDGQISEPGLLNTNLLLNQYKE